MALRVRFLRAPLAFLLAVSINLPTTLLASIRVGVTMPVVVPPAHAFGRGDIGRQNPATGSDVGELRRRAGQGNVDAMLELAWQLLDSKSPTTFSEAARWLQSAANTGSAVGMNNLGWLHEHGIGVRRDAATAATWYQRAAEAGHVTAMVNLGQLYAYDVLNPQVADWHFARSRRNMTPGLKPAFVQENDAAALRWFRLAADRGNTVAMAEIARLYANDRAGEGATLAQPTRRPSATPLAADREMLQWAERAAAGGNTHGVRLLAEYYRTRVAPPDRTTERKFLSQAADLGDPEALYRLALIYLEGDGLPAPDERTAIQFMQRAAERGHAASMRNVAYSYFNGTMTLPKNEAEGLRWARRASEAGDVQATSWLAADYQEGTRGARRDPKAARDLWVRLEASPDPVISREATEQLDYLDAVARNAAARRAASQESNDAHLLVAALIVALMIAGSSDSPAARGADPASNTGGSLEFPASTRPRQLNCRHVNQSFGTLHGIKGVMGGPGTIRICD